MGIERFVERMLRRLFPITEIDVYDSIKNERITIRVRCKFIGDTMIFKYKGKWYL